MFAVVFGIAGNCDESPILSDAWSRWKSAEPLVVLPELRPRRARRAADEDIGMCLALLVLHADGIPDMSGNAATGKCAICTFARKSEHDESCWRRCWIAAKPGGIRHADWRRQVVGRCPASRLHPARRSCPPGRPRSSVHPGAGNRECRRRSSPSHSIRILRADLRCERAQNPAADLTRPTG